MYKAIIIDDEEMARMLLEGMVSTYCPSISVVTTCKDLPTGVKAIRKYKPDLVFLDIEMPGHSGLELLDFFDEDEIDFSIVFVTAYNRYAIQAFKFSAVDYLLKPIEVEELQKAVDLFEKQQNKVDYQVLKSNFQPTTMKKLAINSVSSIVFVELSDILFFQADGSYTKVFLKSGKVLVASKSLKHFELILTEIPDFFRCHKSYIVNLSHVTEYVKSDGGYVKVNTHEIGVSSDKVNLLLGKVGAL